MAVTVDSPVPDSAVERIAALEGFEDVRFADLGTA
jgi:hypothetical protein